MCAILTTGEDVKTIQFHTNVFLEQIGVPKKITAEILRRVIKSIVTYESKS